MFKRSTLRDYLSSIVLAGSILVSPAQIFADDKKPAQEQSIDELTQSEVDSLMQRENVDDILKEEYSSGRIQKVVYNSSSGKTNFRELVYQEHLPSKERKPVIMLVADADGKGWFDKEKYSGDKGDAIIIKKLAQKYVDFKVVFYDPSIDPEFKETEENRFKLGKELDNETLISRPSIFLYGLFDLTNGETKDNNDGNVKKLDIIKGGPKSNGICVLFKDLDTDWLPTNLTNYNSKYVWRTQNKGIKWAKINYGTRSI